MYVHRTYGAVAALQLATQGYVTSRGRTAIIVNTYRRASVPVSGMRHDSSSIVRSTVTTNQTNLMSKPNPLQTLTLHRSTPDTRCASTAQQNPSSAELSQSSQRGVSALARPSSTASSGTLHHPDPLPCVRSLGIDATYARL